MNRRGFTIVELMMVIGVIAVLMTIVTTTAMSSMRGSREKRTEAMKVALQAAIVAYQARDSEGKWPRPINDLADQAETGVLSENDAQTVFRMVVQKSLVDPNGLFVAPSGVLDGKGSGRSFADATNGKPPRRQGIAVSSMVFGYQGKITGKFHRFNIVYHAETDSVTVSEHCHNCLTSSGGCNNSSCETCHKFEQ